MWFEDGNTLYALSAKLSDMLDDLSLARVYLIVDALDECDSGQAELSTIIAYSSSRPSSVKWLVASHSKPDIEERLRTASFRARISLELNSCHVLRAVNVFIDFKVSKLREMKSYKDEKESRALYVKRRTGPFFGQLWSVKSLKLRGG